MLTTLFDICMYTVYGGGFFGTMLRGTYTRQLTTSRNASGPTEADRAVYTALWGVRRKFVDLFGDEQAKRNALNLFPEMRDLPDNIEDAKSVKITSRTKIVFDSLGWPIMLPVNGVRKMAENKAAAEAKDEQTRLEVLGVLADHEDFPALAAAFRSGSDIEIQEAIIARAEWQDRINKVENDPLLDLSTKIKAKADIDKGLEPIFDPETHEYLGGVVNRQPEFSTVKSALMNTEGV